MTGEYMSEYYDFTELLDSEIKPLMDRLRDICSRNKIPFVVAVSFLNNNDGYGIALNSGGYGIERTPNAIVAANMVIKDEYMSEVIMGVSALADAGEDAETLH